MSNAHEPAFPSQRLDACGMPREDISYGLTKREAFAMAAMQGLMADQTSPGDAELIAMASVRMADALLAELEKEPQA